MKYLGKIIRLTGSFPRKPNLFLYERFHTRTCFETEAEDFAKAPSASLFQALGQWRRIGKKRGASDERGLVEK